MEPIATDILGGLAVRANVAPLNFIGTLLLSAVLNFAIAKIYVMTHGGYSYSKNFLHAIVLVGVIVALIMVIIGSDIARAFALVGAMSIVRFRTPLKDSRDLVFIFAAIAIGMACGVQFYLFAVIFTAFMAALLFAFHHWNFGELPHAGYVLKLQLPSGQRDTVAKICDEMCKRASVVSISRLSDSSEMEDVIYEVELNRGTSYSELVDRLTKSVKPLSINVLVGESGVNV